LNLDVDRIRGLIGGWRADAGASGLLARNIALAAARTHLSSGYDVVIPQFLGRPEFIEQVEAVATEVGADFHEIVLLDSKDNVLRRFAERSAAARDPAHVEAQELLEQAGGVAELGEMYDRLLSVIQTRPAAKIVPTEHGEVDRAYRDLIHSLN
jgi:predicted kinase